MALPVVPPVAPMLAKAAAELPVRPGLVYEPKWDGFRSIVFCDGDEVELGSRNEKPLTRYFPELVAALARELPERCVVDGEIVIVGEHGLDFDALLQRIHPAASRVAMLAETTPASFVAFDLLALGDEDLRTMPLRERRAMLQAALGGVAPPVHLTPATEDPELAARWFAQFEGAGLDGVVAKDPELPYVEGGRVMTKVKHARTADCVVGGFRWHKQGGVGSLLLGLYDDRGVLVRAGVCSSFSAKRRTELLDELDGLRLDPADPAVQEHPWWHDGEWEAPQSRWTTGRDVSWEPLNPIAVCEVAYDHLQGHRFRHATTFVRWRPDRDAASATYSQLDTAVPVELEEVFGARHS
jgi:ATP-dependent DNA ligase